MFRRLHRRPSKPPISKDFLQDTKLLPWVTLESHPILKTTLGKNVSNSCFNENANIRQKMFICLSLELL